MFRQYEPEGFTTSSQVRELLAPYEIVRRAGKVRVPFERMPSKVAAELLARLPEAQRNERAKVGAPSFGQLVELSLSIPGAEVWGYRVRPEDNNERVTITHVVIPHEVLDHRAVETLASGLSDLSVVSVGADGSVSARWAAR